MCQFITSKYLSVSSTGSCHTSIYVITAHTQNTKRPLLSTLHTVMSKHLHSHALVVSIRTATHALYHSNSTQSCIQIASAQHHVHYSTQSTWPRAHVFRNTATMPIMAARPFQSSASGVQMPVPLRFTPRYMGTSDANVMARNVSAMGTGERLSCWKMFAPVARSAHTKISSVSLFAPEARSGQTKMSSFGLYTKLNQALQPFYNRENCQIIYMALEQQQHDSIADIPAAMAATKPSIARRQLMISGAAPLKRMTSKNPVCSVMHHSKCTAIRLKR